MDARACEVKALGVWPGIVKSHIDLCSSSDEEEVISEYTPVSATIVLASAEGYKIRDTQ